MQMPKQKRKPGYEVEPQRYFAEFLKEDDAEHLRLFVSELGERLPIPSAILAVGSSVFPDSYWDQRRRINREDPAAEADECYKDIDLLVVPENAVPLDKLERSVQETLDSLRLGWEKHSATAIGTTYHMQDDGSYCPFVHIDYGLHSLTTRLGNRTRVDILLGDEGAKETAARRIKKERKRNFPFSLLYRRETQNPQDTGASWIKALRGIVR